MKQELKPLTETEREQVEKNIPLVIHVVKTEKFKYFGMDFDDMISAGYEALIYAAQTFNPSMGFQFSTYACRCIKTGLLTWVNSRHLISIPGHAYRLAKEYQNYTDTHGYSNREESELLERNGATYKTLYSSYNALHTFSESEVYTNPIDAGRIDEKGFSIERIKGDGTESIDDFLSARTICKIAQDVSSSISERRGQTANSILEILVKGIISGVNYTEAEIAEIVGTSSQWVHAVKIAFRRKMRTELRKAGYDV